MALRKSAVAAPEVQRLTKDDLRRRLRVSNSWLHRWELAGQFPTRHFIGERAMWFLSEVEAWERAQMSRPPETVLSRVHRMNDTAKKKRRSA